MPEFERPMVLCPTQARLSVPYEQPSYERLCEGCRAPLWVGESTLVAIAEAYPTMLPRFRCGPCLVVYAAKGETELQVMMPASQEQQLRGLLGDEATDRLKRTFGIA